MITSLRFTTAILININIVVGAAFFLQAPLIAQKSGVLAPFAWLAVGALLLPLVLVLARLAARYPGEGGLYSYSKGELGPIWGFICGWGYYLGTVAGNAVVLQAFRNQLEAMNITCHFLPISLDTLCLIIFSIINMFNIEFMATLQYLFTTLKCIPFLVIAIGAVVFFSPASMIAPTTVQLSGFLQTIPLVLFAYLGIEACCAIGHVIEDSKTNVARTLLVSFAIIVSLYAVMQFCLIAVPMGTTADPFTAIMARLMPTPFLQTWGVYLVSLALLSSFLGGFYSMFYANNWNLHILAQEKLLPFSKYFLVKNKFGTPMVCLLTQSILIFGFLHYMPSLVMLSTMSDFGIVIAYILSTVAAWQFATTRKHHIIALCSFVSCGALLWLCTKELYMHGIIYLMPYITLLGCGVLYVLYKNRMEKKNI